MQDRIECHVVSGEVFEGQIDATAFGVFGNVAENVGELEGDAGFLGQFFCGRIGVAEDADADEADDRRDEIAILIEIGEGRVGVGSLGGDCFKIYVVPAMSSSRRLRGMLKRCVASRTAMKTGSSVAPVCDAPRQAAMPLLEIVAALFAGNALVIGKVVGLAHEGVDRANGVAARLRKGDEGVVEILGFPFGDGPAGCVRGVQCDGLRHLLRQAALPLDTPRRRNGRNFPLTARSASGAWFVWKWQGGR